MASCSSPRHLFISMRRSLTLCRITAKNTTTCTVTWPVATAAPRANPSAKSKQRDYYCDGTATSFMWICIGLRSLRSASWMIAVWFVTAVKFGCPCLNNFKVRSCRLCYRITCRVTRGHKERFLVNFPPLCPRSQRNSASQAKARE